MREVPKYNVDPEMTDIRSSGKVSVRNSRAGHDARARIAEEVSSGRREIIEGETPRLIPRIPSYEKKKLFPMREVIVFFLSALVLLAGIWVIREAGIFKESIERGEEKARIAFPESLSASVQSWWDILKSGGEAYLKFQNSAGEAIRIARLAEQLSADAIFLMTSGKGDELRARVSELRDGVADLLEARGNLSGNFLSFAVTLREWKDLLDAAVLWLDAEVPHHAIVLFENPSEIRPSGGFVGSFAHVVITKGSITSITTHDINEVDRTRDARIIPPEPLRRISDGWTVADANWFFDFPRSAEKILGFMEESDLFRKEGIRFDGAIALTGRSIEDLLAVTGPVALRDGTRITSEDVITALQREVQGRRSAGDDAPKQVIKELTEIVVRELGTLTEEKRNAVFGRASEWIREKDLMVYMRKSEFRGAFARYGFDGSAYKIPSSFVGDYLAVVAANIEGAKTDLFMEQRVALESRIGMDGAIDNQLTVTRIHNGNRAAEWWYRVQNQIYLMAHVPRGARLTGAQGGSVLKVPSIEKYEREGYVHDPDVAALEKDTQGLLSFPSVRFLDGGGTQIFATWMKVDRGARGVAIFEYSRRLPVPPADGTGYVFVLETQAGIPSRRGVENPYAITLHAPLGFVWRENGLPTYEWKSDDPPGKVMINLTFKEI